MTVTKTSVPEIPETVRVERVLPHPPRRVWRALTEKAAIEKWRLPIAPAKESRQETPLETPGDSVTLRTAPGVRVAYEVTDAEPNRHLSLWWRVQSPETNDAVTTRVTWTLTPEQDGRATRLVIEHKPLGITALATHASAPLNGALVRLGLYLEMGWTNRQINQGAARRPLLGSVRERLKSQSFPMWWSRMREVSAPMTSIHGC